MDKGTNFGFESPRLARVRATNREVVIKWSKAMQQEISVKDLSSSGLCLSARPETRLPRTGATCTWFIQIPLAHLQELTAIAVRKSLDPKQTRINVEIRFNSISPHLAKSISGYIFRKHQQTERHVIDSSTLVLG